MLYTIDEAETFITANKSKVNPQYRPFFHAAPPIGWINDPNGVVYYRNQYHVFYQFYPYGTSWGAPHWGHFVSSDLVVFHDEKVALAPDNIDETGCFSGGAVVNPKNQDELILAYTQHYENGIVRQRQNIARSFDGITFTKRPGSVLTENNLPKNAVKGDFRDPRPIYRAPYYYLFVGSKSLDNIGQILVFRSLDLEHFQFHFTIGPDRRFGTMAECPDFFTLDGKDVILVSATALPSDGVRYKNVNSSLVVIGRFDLENKKYTIESVDEIDLGHDFYAPQTLLDNQNRRIMIAWMNMWGKPYYTALQNHGWNGSLTFPRLLSIKNNHLYQTPVPEIEHYHGNKLPFLNGTTFSKHADLSWTLDMTTDWELRFAHPTNDHDYFVVSGQGGFISLDSSQSLNFPQDKRTFLKKYLGPVSLRILLDTSSVEVFVDGGSETITSLVYIDAPEYRLKFIGNPKSFVQSALYPVTMKAGEAKR